MSGSRYQPAEVEFEKYAADSTGSGASTAMGQMQAQLAAWQGRNFGAATLEQIALGVCEEAGELAHAVLKRSQGIRGFDDDAKFKEYARDAAGDVMVFLGQLLTALRSDMETVYLVTGRQVLARDWKKDPGKAGE